MKLSLRSAVLLLTVIFAISSATPQVIPIPDCFPCDDNQTATVK